MKRYRKYKFKDGKSITIQVNSFSKVEIKVRKGEVLQFLRPSNLSTKETDAFLNLIIDTSECEIIDYEQHKQE